MFVRQGMTMALQEPGDPWANPAFEQSVRATAYFLWEKEGRPEGREQDYWFQALEQCLRQYREDKARAQPSSNDAGVRQIDDNIDDLGRRVNHPDSARMDQPVTHQKK